MVSLGLIGRRLGHSWSAGYFADKFAEEGIEGEYKLYALDDISELKNLLDRKPELDGLNVTIPYKEAVIPFLDRCSPDAEEIGAVNVIKIRRREGLPPLLEGHNSDWKAFRECILPFAADGGESALILGTGGASKAVAYALRTIGITVKFASRTPRPGNPEIKSYAELEEEDVGSCRYIINATPLGMYPDTETYPDIPYRAVTPHHICLDIVYNPLETEFMRRCSLRGAKVKNGLEMLHRQADISWEIWCS